MEFHKIFHVLPIYTYLFTILHYILFITFKCILTFTLCFLIRNNSYAHILDEVTISRLTTFVQFPVSQYTNIPCHSWDS